MALRALRAGSRHGPAQQEDQSYWSLWLGARGWVAVASGSSSQGSYALFPAPPHTEELQGLEDMMPQGEAQGVRWK